MESLAAKGSYSVSLSDSLSLSYTRTHTQAAGQNHKHAHTHTQEKRFLFLCVVFSFSFFFFFLKRTYPNIWIINHLRFLRNWVFLSLVVLVFFFFFFFLSLTSGWKLSFFPLPFRVWTGESSFSELYLTLQRGKRCERRGRRENQ